MRKQTIRAFGFGLLAASAALYISDQTAPKRPIELSAQQMIQRLETENYVVQKKENEQTEKQLDSAQKEMTAPKTAVQSVTVVIESGMSSNEIAAKLKESGIIQDQAAFNQFLTANGYADKLQTGSFVLKKNMTETEVADALTK